MEVKWLLWLMRSLDGVENVVVLDGKVLLEK
jgi:hypothetical protein